MADSIQHPMITSPHRLKLAVFGLNVSNGCSMTSAPGTLQINWGESKRIAQMAEQAGFDALIPVARWRGMGGAVNFNHRNFEPFTWAAGLAAATERIGLFSTCHVPTVHPVRIAKEFATVDHISGGRFGLNIVAGWNESEIGMFGAPQAEHDARYDYADDWTNLLKALWSTEGEFDYEGAHFTCPGAYSEPKPLQDNPLIMSAGNSPRGQQFAATHADLNFIHAPDVAAAGSIAADVKQTAADQGRQMQFFGQCYIISRETEAEAEAYFRQVVDEYGDWEGARQMLDALIPNSQSALGEEWEARIGHLIAGYGALPLIGTPDQIVEGLLKFADHGLAGTTVSWINYEEGIDQYQRLLLPRLVEAGLRES